MRNWTHLLLPALQIRGRIAADRRRIREQNHLRRNAAFAQPPCDHESIAAVVSLAAKDHDAARVQVGIIRPEVFGDGRAGVFHQLQAGHAVALAGEPIDFAHLVGGEGFHANARKWRCKAVIRCDLGADTQHPGVFA